MSDELHDVPLAVAAQEKQETRSETPSQDRAFLIAVCVFALLGISLCVGALVVYARLAPPFLDAMYPTISELTMREAQHLESAHDYAAAFDTYLKALDGRFQGGQNRAFSLYRLGMLQREHGLGTDKPDYLMQAFENARCPTAAFEVVAREMMVGYTTEKNNALNALFERWEAAAETPDEWAMLYFYRGGHSQLAGRPDQARAFWARGEGYLPGSPCAYALGEALYAEGTYALAEYYNNKYLLEGRNPDYLASAQAFVLKLAAQTPAKATDAQN